VTLENECYIVTYPGGYVSSRLHRLEAGEWRPPIPVGCEDQIPEHLRGFMRQRTASVSIQRDVPSAPVEVRPGWYLPGPSWFLTPHREARRL
jgi:hypothetical protein